MLNNDEAVWLAELIVEAAAYLEEKPGLTLEVESNPNFWIQALPEGAEGELIGYTINFPYRNHHGDPLVALKNANLNPPPGSEVVEWEDGGFASIHVRPDVPIIALAHFLGDILEGIVGATPGAVLAAFIEYGF